MTAGQVAGTSLESRIGETVRRTLPKLGPESRAQLEALVTKESLAIIAGVLMAWVVSHAFGIGEIIDVVLIGVGVVSVGWTVFVGIDHLYDFATGVYSARTASDLEQASEHLAKAISILGLQAVLAVLFRGAKATRTGRGGRLNVGTGPKITGMRYKPGITKDPTRAAEPMPLLRSGLTFFRWPRFFAEFGPLPTRTEQVERNHPGRPIVLS